MRIGAVVYATLSSQSVEYAPLLGHTSPLFHKVYSRIQVQYQT